VANDPTAAEALFLAGAESGRVGRTARADVSEKEYSLYFAVLVLVVGVFRMRAGQHTVLVLLSKYGPANILPYICHLFLKHFAAAHKSFSQPEFGAKHLF
jgi:hypothetical protein